MTRLAESGYGKSHVRLTKVIRRDDRDDLMELSVNVALEGAFEKSYLAGDNSQIVATDTMKNTVFGLAKKLKFESIEQFGAQLGTHFVERNKHVTSATIEIEEHQWARIGESGIAFEGSSQEVRTVRVKTSRDKGKIATDTTAGLDGLLVLKTTDSGFVGFLRDEFTTLGEVTDRIFATVVKAEWHFAKVPGDINGSFGRVRAAMLAVFAEHKSLAVQQTLYEMGKAALAVVEEIDAITITMPNKHRIPANLKAMGLEFDNDVYVTTEEPFGNIWGRVVRE